MSRPTRAIHADGAGCGEVVELAPKVVPVHLDLYPVSLPRRGLSIIGNGPPGRTTMSDINWVHDFDAACRQAREERKHILLDFFSPV